MGKRLVYISAILAANHVVFFPAPARAVVPPDFIFNIGSQVAQISSIVLIFATAAFGAVAQFFKAEIAGIKRKKTVLAAAAALVLAATLTGSYLYASYQQKAEYRKWLEKNKAKAPAAQNSGRTAGF